MRKVPAPKVVTAIEATESPLPPRIQEALGELVGAAREGLLALSVGVGLGVVHELMELEVDEVVGPRGRHNPARTAKASRSRGRLDDLGRPASTNISDTDVLLVALLEADQGGDGPHARRRLHPSSRRDISSSSAVVVRSAGSPALVSPSASVSRPTC